MPKTQIIIAADGHIYANGDVEVFTQANLIEPLRTAKTTVLTIAELNEMQTSITREAFNRFRVEEMNENEMEEQL